MYNLSDYYKFANLVYNQEKIDYKAHPFTNERDCQLNYWSKKNIALLKKILPEHLFIKVSSNFVGISDCKNINDIVDEYLFSQFIIDSTPFYEFLTTKRFELNSVVNQIVKKTTYFNNDICKLIYSNNLMMILIRPEIIYLSSIIEEFLRGKGFYIVYRKMVKMNIAEYITLYSHAFSDPIKENHIRRRAFGYVGQHCKLLIFSLNDSNVSSPSEFNLAYKGTTKRDSETLRGSIAFNEALINSLDSRPIVENAVNPYRTYEFLDPQNTNKTKPFGYINNLQSIHTPEDHEITKDMSIFLNKQDIELIKIKCLKLVS
jgi:hypothetical protein